MKMGLAVLSSACAMALSPQAFADGPPIIAGGVQAAQAAPSATGEAQAEATKDDQKVEKVTVVGTKNPRAALTYPGMVDVLDKDQIQASRPVDAVRSREGHAERRVRRRPAPHGRDAGHSRPRRTRRARPGRRRAPELDLGSRRPLLPRPGAARPASKSCADRRRRSTARGRSAASWRFRTADASDLLEPGATAGLRAVARLSGRQRRIPARAHRLHASRRSRFHRLASASARPATSTWARASICNPTTTSSTASPKSASRPATTSRQAHLSEFPQRRDRARQRPGGEHRHAAQQGDRVEAVFGRDPLDADEAHRHSLRAVSHRRLRRRSRSGDAHLRLLRDIETTGFSLDNRSPFTLRQHQRPHHDRRRVVRRRASRPRFGERERRALRRAKRRRQFLGRLRADRSLDRASAGRAWRTHDHSRHPLRRVRSLIDGQSGQGGERAVSPKIAATYQPTEWFFLFGNAGKAFRAPGINELYLSGVHFRLPHPCYLFGLPNCPGGCRNRREHLRAQSQSRTRRRRSIGKRARGLPSTTCRGQATLLRFKGSYWHQDVDDFINLAVRARSVAVLLSPPTFCPATSARRPRTTSTRS